MNSIFAWICANYFNMSALKSQMFAYGNTKIRKRYNFQLQTMQKTGKYAC